jgi:hypothetical protein
MGDNNMGVEAILTIVGGVALLVGIFGGGIEVEKIKIPPIPGGLRIISALTGIILIVIAIVLSRPELLSSILSTQQQTLQPVQQSTQIQQTTRQPSDTSLPPTAIASGSVLFEEDFEDGKAQGIAFISGNWKIVTDDDGNRVYDIDNTGGSGFPGVDFGSTDWKNYAIEYRVKPLTAKAWVILEFRRNLDGSDKYIASVSLEYNHVSFAIALDGSPWQPLTTYQSKFVPRIWYTVRIEARDSEIKVFVDDTVKIDTTDSRIDAGAVNIQVGPSTHAQFDDIRVTALGP